MNAFKHELYEAINGLLDRNADIKDINIKGSLSTEDKELIFEYKTVGGILTITGDVKPVLSRRPKQLTIVTNNMDEYVVPYGTTQILNIVCDLEEYTPEFTYNENDINFNIVDGVVFFTVKRYGNIDFTMTVNGVGKKFTVKSIKLAEE